MNSSHPIHFRSATPDAKPIFYLAPGTPAVGCYVPRLTIVGPDPVPVTENFGSITPGFLHVVTPIGNFTVPTGQGWLLPVATVERSAL